MSSADVNISKNELESGDFRAWIRKFYAEMRLKSLHEWFPHDTKSQAAFVKMQKEVESMNEKEIQEYESREELAKSYLLLCITSELADLIEPAAGESNSLNDYWDQMLVIKQSRDSINLQQLQRSLHNLELLANESLVSYIARADHIFTQ